MKIIEKQKKAGRPKGLKYSERFMVRLTPEQKEKVMNNSEITELIRELINNYEPKIEE